MSDVLSGELAKVHRVLHSSPLRFIDHRYWSYLEAHPRMKGAATGQWLLADFKRWRNSDNQSEVCVVPLASFVMRLRELLFSFWMHAIGFVKTFRQSN